MHNANEIITNLWLGDIRDSRNKNFINNMDIIINCTKDLPFIDENKKCIRVRVEDNLEKQEIENLYKYFEPISQLLHSSLKKGKKIFVHCYAGKQRSATIICAYIMTYLNLSFKDSFQLIKSKRKHIFTPYANFINALILYENKLMEK